MNIKNVIRYWKGRGLNNLEILKKLYDKKPFTSWEGINLADYLNERYKE